VVEELAAVRTTPERSTDGGVTEGSSSTSTWRAPAGCLTDRRGVPSRTARSWPTAPGVTIAVPTLTAPSTPIDSCTRTGMNARVLTVPPCAGGAAREIFGTVAPLTSPRTAVDSRPR
jgi:hypothetical protein